MEKISVIMPAYNSEKFIKKSINSILNQTYSNIELLIINDGSKDSTKEKIFESLKNDDRIKYFEIQNSGSAVARNIGLDNATGDYIVFIDSDDFIDRNMFKIMIDKSLKFDADIVSCNLKWHYSNNAIKGEGLLKEGLFKKNDMIKNIYPELFSAKTLEDTIPKTLVTKLYKRNLINKNMIRFNPELKMSQDIIFSINCLIYANSIYNLPEAYFYHYVRNESSRTNTYLKDAWKIMKINANELEKISSKFPEYPLKKQLPYVTVKNSMTAIANVGRNVNGKSKEKYVELEEIITDQTLQQAINIIDFHQLRKTRKFLAILIKKQRIKLLYVLVHLKSKR